jgi:hypothetical protein
MDGDRCGRRLGGRAIALARRRPLPSPVGRVGVEAEADLAAAFGYDRRQPIGEEGQGISRP